MDLAFVKKLKMQNPQDTLRSLVAQFENAGGPDPVYPYVTVTMGAFAYSGIPVKIEMVRADNYLALFCPERGLRGQDALSYLPLNMISTVTVDNFRHQLHALATGVAPSVGGDVPTRLGLERLAGEVSTKTGKKISLANLGPDAEEGVRAYFAASLKALETVLLVLNSDPLGKEALAQTGQIELRFSEAERLSASKDGGTLKVVVGFMQDLKQLADDLRRNVEKVI
jgi:hypothetical protein